MTGWHPAALSMVPMAVMSRWLDYCARLRDEINEL